MPHHAPIFPADTDGIPHPNVVSRSRCDKKKHLRPIPSGGIPHVSHHHPLHGRPDTGAERAPVERAATHQQADLSDPETNLGLQPFEDPRVFAVPHTYGPPHHGPHDFATRRLDSGPSFIVVGAEVDDARMRRHLPELRERYGVTLEQLQAARGGETVCVRTEAP